MGSRARWVPTHTRLLPAFLLFHRKRGAFFFLQKTRRLCFRMSLTKDVIRCPSLLRLTSSSPHPQCPPSSSNSSSLITTKPWHPWVPACEARAWVLREVAKMTNPGRLGRYAQQLAVAAEAKAAEERAAKRRKTERKKLMDVEALGRRRVNGGMERSGLMGSCWQIIARCYLRVLNWRT